jgi:hypothetical protein
MNLLFLLTSIVQYNLSWDKPASIQSIKKLINESSPLWQKFAQTISSQEEIIGHELASELQDILCNCPTHSHEYSKQVILSDFGAKYDVSDMELVGSGTFAQAYRVGKVCIKIRHPNVSKEVNDAVLNYNNVRPLLFFMPNTLKQICDNFFTGISEQLDFHREYNNGVAFKQKFHDNTDPKRRLYVIPKMLDKSNECLVMDYEPSQPLLIKGRSSVSDIIMVKAIHGLLAVPHICCLNGIMHADLHFGNYGIRGGFDDLQIVIYDFGHMYDLSGIPIEIRKKIIMSGDKYDTVMTASTVIENEYHNKWFLNSLKSTATNKPTFDTNIKLMVAYIAINNLDVKKEILHCILSSEKTMSSTNLLLELEKKPGCKILNECLMSSPKLYYEKYFNHDDLKLLADMYKNN